jgi:hypothetical protein
LQEEVVKALQAGATIKATCDSLNLGVSTFTMWVAVGEAYSNGEDHKNMPRKIVDREALSAFSAATTRAKSVGLVTAAARFRQGMNPSETVSITSETKTETRLRTIKHPDGRVEQVPYDHISRVEKQTTTHHPGDWRAAESYLARRDTTNWGKQEVAVDVDADVRIRIVRKGDDGYDD